MSNTIYPFLKLDKKLRYCIVQNFVKDENHMLDSEETSVSRGEGILLYYNNPYVLSIQGLTIKVHSINAENCADKEDYKKRIQSTQEDLQNKLNNLVNEN